MPLFSERQADLAVSAEQVIARLSAESCLLVICGLRDWTRASVCRGKVLGLVTQSGRPAGDVCVPSDPCAPGALQVVVPCRNALLFRPCDLSGSFCALQVEEEFVEVSGRFLELGKTLSFLFELGFCFFISS